MFWPHRVSDDFMLGFIVGDYQFIVKSLNSDDTCLGQIQFSESKEKLVFVKTINNKTINGSVEYERTDGNKV